MGSEDVEGMRKERRKHGDETGQLECYTEKEAHAPNSRMHT